MTFTELVEEYRTVGIGPRIYAETRRIVRAVARSYDPVVYGGASSWEEASEDLVQEFGLEVLVGQGQLDYAITVAADREHFRRLLARQVRHLLARRRRRTIVDNLIDRAHRMVESPPFRTIGRRAHWSYTLLGKEVVDGQVSDAAARSVASRLAEVPTIRAEPSQRAPAVYSEHSLRIILSEVAEAVTCPVGTADLDRIFSLLLTSWLPSFLKEGETAVESAATNGLDAEGLAIVQDTVNSILAGCTPEDLAVLRLKLEGVSDRTIGERLRLSRPTVSKLKRRAMRHIERRLADLDEPLRLAVVDRVGAALGAVGGRPRGSS